MDRAAYERFLPLVRRTAMRLARRVPSTITVADLVSYGWVGLMEAFQRSAAAVDAERRGDVHRDGGGRGHGGSRTQGNRWWRRSPAAAFGLPVMELSNVAWMISPVVATVVTVMTSE